MTAGQGWGLNEHLACLGLVSCFWPTTRSGGGGGNFRNKASGTRTRPPSKRKTFSPFSKPHHKATHSSGIFPDAYSIKQL